MLHKIKKIYICNLNCIFTKVGHDFLEIDSFVNKQVKKYKALQRYQNIVCV